MSNKTDVLQLGKMAIYTVKDGDFYWTIPIKGPGDDGGKYTVGPFASLWECMNNYANFKKEEKSSRLLV